MHETKEKPHKIDQHAQNQHDMKTTPQKIQIQPNMQKSKHKMEDHNSWQTQLEVKIEKMKKKPSKPRKQEQK